MNNHETANLVTGVMAAGEILGGKSASISSPADKQVLSNLLNPTLPDGSEMSKVAQVASIFGAAELVTNAEAAMAEQEDKS